MARPVSEQDLESARAALARGDLGAATRLAKGAFQRAKTAADRAAMGRARLVLGEAAIEEQRLGAAREALTHAARELGEALGAVHHETRQAQGTLALALAALDDVEGAGRALAAAAADLPSPDGAIDEGRARVWLCVAVAYMAQGRAGEAARLLAALVERAEGPPALAAVLQRSLGVALDATGDRQGALAAHRRALEAATSAFGEESARVAEAALAVARSRAALGEVDEARALAQTAMDRLGGLGLEREPRWAVAWATLGLCTVLGGDLPTGSAQLETACKLEEKGFGAVRAPTAAVVVMLARAHHRAGDHAKVLGLAKRVVAALKREPGYEGPLAMITELEARGLVALGRPRDAVARVQDIIEPLARRRGATAEQMARLYLALGAAEIGCGRGERARVAWERSRALAVEAGGAGSDLAREVGAALDLLEHGTAAARGAK
jgi:tetratricopeptide (TPR) repeat protein